MAKHSDEADHGGTPDPDDLPSTIARSDAKAQRTYAKTLEHAEEEYGDGERAHRTAFSALKHTHEKVGDHWEPKAGGRKGPSDAQAEGGRDTHRRTAEGVDANATKEHLLEVARRLDVPGRSSMDKGELVEAIKKANARETRRSRGS
ncbi:ChaB family protein [Kineococcus glutinatus]|uniref:ChaB family protein n=1 Tax=Kineococcus glutinatus TaxID=1070872 RepID=A0ABP9HUS5_9ACTN